MHIEEIRRIYETEKNFFTHILIFIGNQYYRVLAKFTVWSLVLSKPCVSLVRIIRKFPEIFSNSHFVGSLVYTFVGME